ncbi:MAG TPA: hypothetical protein VF516_18040 [Kofleriaceae bacterium]
MLRLVAIASLAVGLPWGCRISLEDNVALTADGGSNGRACTVSTTSQPCMDATTHSDLAFIEQKIFAPSCNFSGCHDSATDSGKLDLRAGVSHDHLVGVASQIDTTRKLVVPNDAAASYLMLMLRDVAPAMASPPGNPPPGSVGFMPQGAPTLCCQKLDAIERWINAGAPNH